MSGTPTFGQSVPGVGGSLKICTTSYASPGVMPRQELWLTRSDASPGLMPHQELYAPVGVMPQQELCLFWICYLLVACLARTTRLQETCLARMHASPGGMSRQESCLLAESYASPGGTARSRYASPTRMPRSGGDVGGDVGGYPDSTARTVCGTELCSVPSLG